MDKFSYGIFLHWKLNIRNIGVYITFYIVPLLFFVFMSGIFHVINPSSIDTLIQIMTVFSVTIGALLGCPIPLIEIYGSNIKSAYKVGGVPLWLPAINNFISSFIHLYIVSLIIFFVSPVAFSAKVPANLPLYFVNLGVFIIASISVGTLIGLMVKSRSMFTLVSIVVFVPSLILSGIMFPVEMLPEVLRNFGKMLPASAGFAAMTVDKIDFLTIFPMIHIVVVACIICSVTLNKMNKKPLLSKID